KSYLLFLWDRERSALENLEPYRLGLGRTAGIQFEVIFHPFRDVPSQIKYPEWTATLGVGPDRHWPPFVLLSRVRSLLRPVITPGVDAPVGSPSCIFALGFGWEPLPRPVRILARIVPGHIADRPLAFPWWIGAVFPGWRGAIARLPDKPGVLLVGHFFLIHVKAVYMSRMPGFPCCEFRIQIRVICPHFEGATHYQDHPGLRSWHAHRGL